MKTAGKKSAKTPPHAAPETAADLGKRLKTAIADVGALFDDPIGVFEDSGVPYSFSQVREAAGLDQLDALKKRMASENPKKANQKKVAGLAAKAEDAQRKFKALPAKTRSRKQFAHDNAASYGVTERTLYEWLKGL